MGLRILFFYFLAISVINVLIYLNQRNALLHGFLNGFYTVVEAGAFISFLFLELKNTHVKKALAAIGSLFILFALLYPYMFKSVDEVDSVQIGLETIIVLIFSFYYLYEKTNDTETLYIYSTFPFWIVVGMVLYLGGSFFIYLFAASINKDVITKYWAVTNFLSFIKNILIAIGIAVNSKPTKKIPTSDFELSSLN